MDKKFVLFNVGLFKNVNPQFRIYVVTSHPKSDMGKGHLTLALSESMGNCHIIKYDGLLNLSIGDRYIFHPKESDDFLLYRRNTELTFSKENAFMLGDIIKSFLIEYGENITNFSFRPHIAEFTLKTLYQRWVKIGAPANLILEIGGTMSDREVEPIWPYIIRRIRKELGQRSVIVNLISEISHSGEQLKTRGLQDTITALLGVGVEPDKLFLRVPLSMPDIISNEEIKCTVEEKLRQNCLIFINGEDITIIPYWKDRIAEKYKVLVKGHKLGRY